MIASRAPRFVSVKAEEKKEPLAPEEEMTMGTNRVAVGSASLVAVPATARVVLRPMPP